MYPVQLPTHRAQQASDGLRHEVETLELELENLADHFGYEFTHRRFARTRLPRLIVAAVVVGIGVQ